MSAMNICLFTPQEIDKPLDLRDERAKHIITVLHKSEGDSFEAGIIGGKAGTARITKISRQELTAPNGKSYTGGSMEFTFTAQSDGKPLYPLTMIIGFPRPIQLKRLLRDMAGLGADTIYLTGTELGEKSYLKSDLATSEAGYGMLLQGTEQAASTHIPRLVKTPDLAYCLAQIKADSTTDEPPLLLALDNVCPVSSLTAYLAAYAKECATRRIVAAIGSERGWTENERNLLCSSGFTLLGMGKRVLRTETAATVAASLILSAMGCL